MMYPYMTLADDTEITHSQIIEAGFDSARCELPEYKRILIDGYSEEEVKVFEQLLQSNAHLFYKYAVCGGVEIS